MNQTTKVMKKLALIAFLIPALAFGQDAMELKTIQYLNEYRASKGLAPVVLDKGLSKAAQNQLSYEVLIDSVSHYQYRNIPNFDEIVRPQDRINHFSGLSAPLIGSEITSGAQFPSNKVFDLLNPDLSKGIIELFKDSKGHNEAMINPEAHKAGISIIVNRNYPYQGKIGVRYFCVITFGI